MLPISPQTSFKALGLVRVSAVSPALRVADVAYNTEQICSAIRTLRTDHQCDIIAFPELALTGYTCADLFYQTSLLHAASNAIATLCDTIRETGGMVIVGLPIEQHGRLFNCAVVINHGIIKGIVPKTYLPNTQEFYEERWFSSSQDVVEPIIRLHGQDIPFGADLLFTAEDMPHCTIGVEICEDLWAVIPPSSAMALHGATIIVNPSASDELLGKAEYRRTLLRNQSGRCIAAYCYSASGAGESTTDLVFSGHSLIAENGTVMAETERFHFTTCFCLADIDVQHLVNERMKNNSFGGSSIHAVQAQYRRIICMLAHTVAPQKVLLPYTSLYRLIPPSFFPIEYTDRAEYCREVFSIQTTGLAKRLRHINARTAVLGISGGLDSTLALLAVVKAFDLLGYPRTGIHAITMPGFGTTSRTKSNAEQLTEHFGVSLRIVPIAPAVRQHFEDIGHDENIHDVTYENSQARERTQILMDIANQVNGIVIGTGDLSELALGWCTFNGDHISMYNVNVDIPKTLVQYVVEWCATTEFSGEEQRLLLDILHTPISPELLPGSDDTITQDTEQTLGPYIVHDFILYYAIRMGFTPVKIVLYAERAFAGVYTFAQIMQWARIFYKRFFAHQFKRSCLPDGPKIGSLSLSPRGYWRMPSDALATVWLEALDALERERAGQ